MTHSMEKLKTIFGIPFGISRDELFEKLEGRYYHYSKDMDPSPNTIKIYYIELAGRDTKCVFFNFYQNQLCSVEIVYVPEFEDKIIEEYNSIKKEISNRYYVSENDFFEFEPPHYPTNDFSEIIKALNKGHLKIECWWNFKSDTDLDDYISIKISSDEKIHLKYENSELTKKYIENLKLSDY